MNPLVLRADCTTQTGTGHVMRCLALAQACLDGGGKPFLLTRELPPLLAERLVSEGIEIVELATSEASETIREAHRLGAKWIVTDGYHFAPEYPGALRQAGFSVLMIDDMGSLPSCEVDTILNQNFHADVSLYGGCAASTRLLLGTRYVLLRREFREPAAPRQTQPVARRILVLAGGSDPSGYTLDLLRLAAGIGSDVEVRVVVGAANARVAEITATTASIGGRSAVLSNVVQMRPLMEWADLALTAGGTTVYELAAMGVPVIGFSQIEPEIRLLCAAEALHACFYLGNFSGIREQFEPVAGRIAEIARSAECRRRVADEARALVDGCGSQRVLAAMYS